MKRITLLIILILININLLFAQWTKKPMYGGDIMSFAGWAGSFCIATSDDIYKSDDGQTWYVNNGNLFTTLNEGIGNSAILLTMNSTLYFVSNGVIVKSENGGINWQRHNTGLDTINWHVTNIYTFKNKLYCISEYASSYNIYENKNTHWEFAKAISKNKIHVTDSFLYLYDDLLNNTILRSSDGVNFASYTTTGLVNSTYKYLTGNSTDLFVIEDNSKIKSSHNGGSWVLKTQGLPGGSYELHGLTMAGNILFVTLRSMAGVSVYKSSDLGAHWELCNIDNVSFPYTYIHKVNDKLIWSSGDGIYISADLGTTWNRSSDGITARRIEGITNIGDTLLASAWWGRIQRSIDGGNTWQATGSFSKQSVTDGIYKYKNLAFVTLIDYNQLNNGIYKSDDAGITWTITIGPDGEHFEGEFYGENGNFIFTKGSSINHAYRTTDMVNYSEITIPLRSFPLMTGENSETYLWYINHRDSIFRSPDNGDTWAIDTAGLPKQYPFSRVSKIFYLNHQAHLVLLPNASSQTADLYKKNNGKWEKVNTTGIDKRFFNTMRFHDDKVYGVIEDNIYYSNDGIIWNMIPNTGLSSTTDFSRYTVNNQGIFYGTYNSGIWHHSSSTGMAPHNNVSKINVSHYPNPVDDQFVIDFKTSKNSDAKIELFDYTGKSVKQLIDQEQKTDHSVTITTNNLPAGIYIYKVITTEGTGTGKVVKF